jgi:hypothetical protein
MMRLTVHFSRPLPPADQTILRFAVGGLAKTSRVRFQRGGYEAWVFGEAVAVHDLAAALAAEGLTPERIETSLDTETDEALAADAKAGERFKAIGR